MHADIPYLKCFVHLEEISTRDGMEEAYAFAVQSIKGRALGFHCMLKSGAHYRNVPLHALALTQDAPKREPQDVAMWDCFSSRPIVTVFDYLVSHECRAYLPNGHKEDGVYLFTVDWLPDDATHPGFILQPDQNKCGHVLALECGCLAMLPSNRIAWRDAYFIGKDPHPEEGGYITQSVAYQAESCERDQSKSDKYFYGISPERPDRGGDKAKNAR